MRKSDAQKHRAILDAATQLFLKRGYGATSMDDVARGAGVTKQTVYAHFTNKDALFHEMVLGLSKETPPIPSLPSKKKPFEAQLFEMGMIVSDLITNPKVVATTRLVIAEMERSPTLAQLYYESGTHSIIAMIAAFLAPHNHASVAIENLPSAASYFLALLKGKHYLHSILGIEPACSRKAQQAHVRETVAIFMRIYAPSGPLATRSVL